MLPWFRELARWTSIVVGSSRTFIVAGVVLLVVVAAGALSGYPDRWLAVFSATLSAITFMLVFLLQYRENRDTVAMQLKLNELLRAVEGARGDEFLDLEHLAEEEQETVSQRLREQVLNEG